MEQATSEEAAWAAGLFEGEGNMAFRGKTSAELQLGMVDRDVVDRFHRIVGCGSVRCEVRRDGHQDLFRWSVCNVKDVGMVLSRFWPYMGLRRQEKASEVLERIAKCRGKRRDGVRSHCPAGHPYDESNSYIQPGTRNRQCRTCRREHDRRHKMMKRRVA